MTYRLLALLLLAWQLPAAAQSPEEKGLALARAAEQKAAGWGDTRATMTMILRDRSGKESVREIRSRALEVAGDGDKSLIVFDQPRDVAGTALLTFAHKQGDDDRWLYLPALKRVKRIAGSNQAGSFMGSEFAYEDLGSQEIEKYNHRWLRDETLNGLDCHVLERTPRDPNSGYTRQIAWMDTAELRLQKVEFYDRKNSLLKTLTVQGYKQYAGRHWRPDQLDMVNQQNGKSTTLRFRDYQFGTGLTDRDFDQNSLQNVR
ncbi:MAG: outer membrane lipoprotein-sorting protein [Gammaproteobacteria bacterium]